jgi:hypothetical protein
LTASESTGIFDHNLQYEGVITRVFGTNYAS